jgi:hypothetical protein
VGGGKFLTINKGDLLCAIAETAPEPEYKQVSCIEALSISHRFRLERFWHAA